MKRFRKICSIWLTFCYRGITSRVPGWWARRTAGPCRWLSPPQRSTHSRSGRAPPSQRRALAPGLRCGAHVIALAPAPRAVTLRRRLRVGSLLRHPNAGLQRRMAFAPDDFNDGNAKAMRLWRITLCFMERQWEGSTVAAKNMRLGSAGASRSANLMRLGSKNSLESAARICKSALLALCAKASGSKDA